MKVSQMTQSTTPSADDVLMMLEGGTANKKITFGQIADWTNSERTVSGLKTTAKTVVGAVNEVKSSVTAAAGTAQQAKTSADGAAAAVSVLDTQVTELKNDLNDIGFIERKNLFSGIVEGKYSIAWNIGDTVRYADNENYAYAIADVEGHTQVTLNASILSDSYSFFTDSDNKKVAASKDCRVGTSRVYNVPEGAKYFYVSSTKEFWQAYGLVALDGNADITTIPVGVDVYPYNTRILYADGLKLLSGVTIGDIGVSHVYHVEKDGSGDYTSLVAAINEATKHMDSIVYVGAGEWDIIDELGTAYMDAVSSSSSTWGLVLKNRIHVIGTAKTVVKAEYTGSNANVTEYFSAFNAGLYGFTLENIHIKDNNIRYSVHDDKGSSGPTPYTNRYINCSMIHKNGKYTYCIGGGIGENSRFEIIGCYFEGDVGKPNLVYFHGNNNKSVTDAHGEIIVRDNYFANDGTFKLVNYGNSTTVSTAYVSNNSFGSALEVIDGSSPSPIIKNMEIVAWNNEVRTA